MSRRVFVSSTKKDLTEHRSSVQEALRILGAHDISMENLGARDERPPEECARLVREDSDIFVGIYAHRYGCVPDGASVSICEMEYRAATEARLPRFIYLVDDDWPWPPKYIDQAPDDVRRMQEFKSVLLKGHMCQSFGSEDDLAKKVVADVGRHLAMHAAKRVPSGHRDRIELGAFSHIGVESIPVEAVTPAMVNAAHPSNQRRNEIYRRNRGVFLTTSYGRRTNPGSRSMYTYIF